MDIPVTRSQDRWPLRLVALLLAAVGVFWMRKTGMHWTSITSMLPLSCLVFASVALGIAAALLRDGPALAKLCAALLFLLRMSAICIALPELVASRLPVRWDVLFGVVLPKSECPIYYRMPDTLFDEGRFLKRTGPDAWTGRPLQSALRMKHSRDAAYADEASFTVRYDADGFRNPPGLTDWDAVVAGDSFVELGSLPDGETITDRLATSSALRIKNLGVASIGPMNQEAFLRHFGRALSCHHALLVWSEAALAKTADEWVRLRAGRSPLPPPADNSLLRAAWGAFRMMTRDGGTRLFANASFTDAGGNAVPVMLDPPYPPAPEALSRDQQEALRSSFHQWAETARSMKMEPWLVFLPSKIRVWQGRLSGPDELIQWKPGTLPDHVEKICRESGIHFVDTTAALTAASQRGVLAFNPVVDGHPTKDGAEIIANVVAMALRSAAASGGH